MTRLAPLLTFLLVVAIAAGAEIKVATLNCFLLFDPTIEHRGKVDDEQRMNPAKYVEKLGNLASLLRGYQVVALQETGGRAEIAALAKRSGMSWAWEQGRDTATGEEVGVLHNLPGWQVSSRGRVAALDRIVSKHLLVDAKNGSDHVYFLAVHLLRPIGTQSAKHQAQLTAIGEWMNATSARAPGAVVVVLGDMNSTLTSSTVSLFGVGTEAGAQNGFRATHLTNKAYDRMVLLGPATWRDVEVRRPPYGNRPIAEVKRVWTDHFLLGATFRTQ